MSSTDAGDTAAGTPQANSEVGTPVASTEVTVACVQMAPVFGALDANLAHASALLADVRADLIVLPELLASGYSFRDRNELRGLAESPVDGPTARHACAWSRKTGGVVVVGFAEDAGEAIYNAALVAADGEIRAVYRKLHLFGFERDVFTPGDGPLPVVEHRGMRVGVMICFDWMFPEAARSLALKGADVIAHPSNLVTPGWCQRAMPVRALENMVAIATANRFGTEARDPRPALTFTGESLLVDPWGAEVARAPAQGDAIAKGRIDLAAARLKRFPSGNRPLHERRPDQYDLDPA